MDTFQVGKRKAHRVEEWRGESMTPHLLFTGFDADRYAETRDGVGAAYLDHRTNAIQAPIQSSVVEAGETVILFDTGCANHKVRPGIPLFDNLDKDFLERLAATGFAADDIDPVVCSHLHVDHVGWNTRLRGDDWVPTFPNARYLLPAPDVEYWDSRNRDKFPAWWARRSMRAFSRTAFGRSWTGVSPIASAAVGRSQPASGSTPTLAIRPAARP